MSKNESELAKKRFVQEPFVNVSHIPQCNLCEYNVNINACKKIKLKPLKYVKNLEKCKYFEKEK